MIRELRQVTRASGTAFAIAKYLSQRERSVKGPYFHTRLCRLRNILSKNRTMSEAQFYAFFEELDRLGIGKVKRASPLGKPLFFVWDKRPKEVGLAALGKDVPLLPVASARVKRKEADYSAFTAVDAKDPAYNLARALFKTLSVKQLTGLLSERLCEPAKGKP
jgi:hypothetical protein